MQKLVDDMIQTMGEHRSIGLAAPQVHYDLRLYIAFVSHDDRPDTGGVITLSNPELTVIGGDVAEGLEGCPGIPGVHGLAPRAREIGVAALNREGARIEFVARDGSARVIQHARICRPVV